MTFAPSSIELAFLWNAAHGLLGAAVKSYVEAHPDQDEALLRVFRLGGNALVQDLIERGADPATYTPAPEVAPFAPLSPAESLLIRQLRDGDTETAADTLAELLMPEPKPTWREQVAHQEHYLLAFGIAGALVHNRIIDIDLFDANWYRAFEHAVCTIEDALNALDN